MSSSSWAQLCQGHIDAVEDIDSDSRRRDVDNMTKAGSMSAVG